MAILKGNQSDDLTLKYLIEQNKGGSSPVDVPKPSDSIPLADGTADAGSSDRYSRGDHVHPNDTTKQDVLVSGDNIKTINGNSLLGSGDISLSDFLLVDIFDEDNITVNAQNFVDATVDIGKTGYTPIGIIGWEIYNASSSGTYRTKCFLYRCYIDGNTLYYGIGNYHTSNAKIHLEVKILYRKN